MKLAHTHPWEVTPAAARQIQESLRPQVERDDRLAAIETVAGVDVGFEEQGSTVRAAIAVLSFPALQPLEQALARVPTRFPYIPGLLSFRELPGVLAALARLRRRPDLLLCDGQGYAHPRRFGIACHLGVLTGLPSIGVGKSRLIGRFDPPGPVKGDWSPLRDGGEIIGAVVRSRAGVQPIFVSIGHRVSLATAIRLTLACTTRFKLPETTRAAHRLASG